jgi:hypothetical protein
MTPAAPPMANVDKVPSFSPGATYDCAACLIDVYALKRTAEFAAWRAVVGTNPLKKPLMPCSLKMIPEPCRKPLILGLACLRSSINCVLILSKGVTASKLSVAPAQKPDTTVIGPLMVPSSFPSIRLYWSKATNLTPALMLFPMIRVVHPAYHCFPNGGNGSF